MYTTLITFAVILSKALNCYVFPNSLFHPKGVHVIIIITIIIIIIIIIIICNWVVTGLQWLFHV